MRVRGLIAALASMLVCAAPAAAQAPGISPPGANDWSCHPTAAHPYPVVLVHGTFGDMTVSWNLIAPKLAHDGYCVFALDYGNRATGPIEQSAAQLRDFVNRVLAATGAKRVSMVGHSQGGMMPRYYIKFLGGAGKVDDLIGLAPSNHGTSNPGALVLNAVGVCYSCGQQATGSAFLTKLNAGDETPGNVAYTNVETRNDEVVLPYTSAFLSGANTTNVLLQDRCPLDVSEHLSIIYDPVALRWIENALARKGPADPGYRPGCLPL